MYAFRSPVGLQGFAGRGVVMERGACGERTRSRSRLRAVRLRVRWCCGCSTRSPSRASAWRSWSGGWARTPSTARCRRPVIEGKDPSGRPGSARSASRAASRVTRASRELVADPDETLQQRLEQCRKCGRELSMQDRVVGRAARHQSDRSARVGGRGERTSAAEGLLPGLWDAYPRRAARRCRAGGLWPESARDRRDACRDADEPASDRVHARGHVRREAVDGLGRERSSRTQAPRSPRRGKRSNTRSRQAMSRTPTRRAGAVPASGCGCGPRCQRPRHASG